MKAEHHAQGDEEKQDGARLLFDPHDASLADLNTLLHGRWTGLKISERRTPAKLLIGRLRQSSSIGIGGRDKEYGEHLRVDIRNGG